MVRVIKAHERSNEKGTYVTLELQGDIVMVQSQNSGRFYATAKRCFIFSTFDMRTAETLIGSQMPGSIERIECETYDYTIAETGEVIKLAHTYGYVPHDGAEPTFLPSQQKQEASGLKAFLGQ
jgi:hypothetical protein